MLGRRDSRQGYFVAFPGNEWENKFSNKGIGFSHMELMQQTMYVQVPWLRQLEASLHTLSHIYSHVIVISVDSASISLCDT